VGREGCIGWPLEAGLLGDIKRKQGFGLKGEELEGGVKRVQSKKNRKGGGGGKCVSRGMCICYEQWREARGGWGGGLGCEHGVVPPSNDNDSPVTLQTLRVWDAS
jgi:hypothetical protein